MIKIKGMFYGFFKYKDLQTELVLRDIKIRYSRSVLGIVWTLLNPILMMTVMTLVFLIYFVLILKIFQYTFYWTSSVYF